MAIVWVDSGSGKGGGVEVIQGRDTGGLSCGSGCGSGGKQMELGDLGGRLDSSWVFICTWGHGNTRMLEGQL